MIHIKVKQQGHEWTIDHAHCNKYAEVLRGHYESTGCYDRVWIHDVNNDLIYEEH